MASGRQASPILPCEDGAVSEWAVQQGAYQFVHVLVSKLWCASM